MTKRQDETSGADENLILNEVYTLIKSRTPDSFGFQHTDYARVLHDIALTIKNSHANLSQKDTRTVLTALNEAEAHHRGQYGRCINLVEWNPWVAEMRKLLGGPTQ